MYTTNNAGQINEIYYYDDLGNADPADDVDYINGRDGKYKVSTGSTVNYKPSTDKLGSDFIVDSSVIVANKDATPNTITKKSNLSLTSKAVFDEDAVAPYSYDAIIDSEKNIVIAVVYGAVAKVDKASIPMYVTAIGSSVDADGNSVATVGGYVDGEFVTIKVDYAATNV